MPKLIQKLKTITVSFFSLERRRLLWLLIFLVILFVFKLLYTKYFTQNTACIITGCNGEICQSKNDPAVASLCLWKEEYKCYESAKCEVQANKKCGWTQTSELADCLQQSR